MNSSAEGDVVPQSIVALNSLRLVGVVILFYDYALTFPEEFGRVWQHPKSLFSVLFFLNRYLPTFGPIVATVGIEPWVFTTESVCSQFSLFHQIMLIINQIIVCVILFLRTFALYGRSWRVGGSIFTFALALLGVSCWSVVSQKSTMSLQGGCHTTYDALAAVHAAVPWQCLLAFDLMIFSLTLFKTYRTRKRGPLASAHGDIISLIMRDGAVYFAVMASANLANVLTFYLLQPLLRGCLSTPASTISVTMMSRLMLNLHASASRTRTSHTPDSLTLDSADSPSLFFSTHISMAPTLGSGSGASADGPITRWSEMDMDTDSARAAGDVYEMLDSSSGGPSSHTTGSYRSPGSDRDKAPLCLYQGRQEGP